MGKKKSIPKMGLQRPPKETTPDPAAADAFVQTGSASTSVNNAVSTDVHIATTPPVQKKRKPPRGVKERQDGTWYKPIHFHLDYDLYRALQLAKVDHGGDQTEHLNKALRAYLEELGYEA